MSDVKSKVCRLSLSTLMLTFTDIKTRRTSTSYLVRLNATYPRRHNPDKNLQAIPPTRTLIASLSHLHKLLTSHPVDMAREMLLKPLLPKVL